jgi:multiple sugar transport system substrate-binding protein
VKINEIAAKGTTPFSLKFGEAFNDPNGPWLVLIRDQIFGDQGKLAADNKALDAVLGAK